MKHKKLGELLHEQGKISVEDLSRAIYDQAGKAIRLGEMLLERGLVHKFDLLLALEEIIGIPYRDCSRIVPTADALERIPRAIAERCCTLPVELDNAGLTVVMAEPQNLSLVDELRFTSGAEIIPRLGFTGEILGAIAQYYAVAEAPVPTELERKAADDSKARPKPAGELLRTFHVGPPRRPRFRPPL